MGKKRGVLGAVVGFSRDRRLERDKGDKARHTVSYILTRPDTNTFCVYCLHSGPFSYNNIEIQKHIRNDSLGVLRKCKEKG